MKKNAKRLQLSTETLRKLSPGDLTNVVGGTGSTLTLLCPVSQQKTICACPSRACEY